MKAPDKICIRKDDTAPLGLTPYWIYTVKVREHDIEYICKDALISFLEKEKFDLYNWHFQDEDRKFKVYEEVINKIKEL